MTDDRPRIDRSEELATAPLGRLLASTTAHTTFAVATYGIYALTNAWFVSHWVGPVALAAVNVSAPILLILGAVATTVGAGGASVLARALGAGDLTRAARVTGTALVSYWIVALLIGWTSIAFLDPLLALLGAHGEVLPYARDYALILLAGSVLSTGFSSLVRAEGRITYAMALWVVPVLVQVTLDPILIIGFDLGVRGAALGTVAGQGVSAVMGASYFLLRKDRPYRVTWPDLRPRWPLVREISSVGAPSFLAGLGSTVLSITVNNLLALSGGALALGAYAIATRIGTFVQMPLLGLTQAMQPIVGFNHGRGLTARAQRAMTLAVRTSVAYGVAMTALVGLLARPVAGLMSDDPATVALAATALGIMTLAYPLAGLVPLVAAWFQSLGLPRPAFLLVVGTVALIRIPAVLALGLSRGDSGIWWAHPVGELLAAGIALGLLLRLRRSG